MTSLEPLGPDLRLRTLTAPGVALSMSLPVVRTLARSHLLVVRDTRTRRVLALLCLLAGGLLVQGCVPVRGWRFEAVLAVLCGGLCLLVLLLGGWRRWVHLPRAGTWLGREPTVQWLSEQLVAQRDSGAIRQLVQDAVAQGLPATSARVCDLRQGERVALPDLPQDLRARLAEGRRVWSLESPWPSHLLLPIRSQGQLLGALVLEPREDAVLCTASDLAFLENVTSVAAVALRQAELFQEQEASRRLEQGAARDEKRLALDLLVAELSHELAYPLNFFRYLLKQAVGGDALDRQDVEIGLEEVERIHRMLVSLRQLSIPPPRLAPIPVVPRLQRALGLIRELLQDKQLSVSFEVPEELHLMAESDPIVQVFANLLRNAAQAVEPRGAIGLRHFQQGHARVLEVWDSGPGIPDAIVPALFTPRFTTRAGGMGLGLAVTQRLVRGFGWSLQLHREPGRTCFRIVIPPSAEAPPPPSQEDP